ncbi:hypothetical protein [Bradyrhizobium sp. USDA 3458]|uniref:hypothetical protein n=1 Tax=Bradyrhizobium sp. USDA 3458 TaxID=2591461 RepID=UPI0013304DB8|nr:hypothetical protein [Bradyrhizobium sp. USDA 3458]
MLKRTCCFAASAASSGREARPWPELFGTIGFLPVRRLQSDPDVVSDIAGRITQILFRQALLSRHLDAPARQLGNVLRGTRRSILLGSVDAVFIQKSRNSLAFAVMTHPDGSRATVLTGHIPRSSQEQSRAGVNYHADDALLFRSS